MKKIILLMALTISVSAFAQKNTTWFTNHKEAISIAESQNKNILVFAFKNLDTETSEVLQNALFNSEDFNTLASHFVFLKLDVNSDSYNKRLAAHYSGVKTLPVIALIDNKGNRIGTSLKTISHHNIQNFIKFLKDNIE